MTTRCYSSKVISVLLSLLFFIGTYLTTPVISKAHSSGIPDTPFTKNGQLKLGIGYPELWTIEVEKTLSRENSASISYHGIKYIKNQESINLYGYTIGWRDYLTQHYGQFEGWFWGAGVMNRILHITQSNITISGVPGSFNLDATARLWMVYAEIGNTFLAPPFTYGLTFGLGYGSPSLNFSEGTAALLDFEIPSFWPIFRVWAGVTF